jgi:hypothetical protein
MIHLGINICFLSFLRNIAGVYCILILSIRAHGLITALPTPTHLPYTFQKYGLLSLRLAPIIVTCTFSIEKIIDSKQYINNRWKKDSQ